MTYEFAMLLADHALAYVNFQTTEQLLILVHIRILLKLIYAAYKADY